MSDGQRRVVAIPTPTPATSGHLNLGGTSRSGGEITVDSQSLWRDGEPWFPVMGEFHFSRYPRQEWESELRKMKAGGITVVGTYIFWIVHEERRGRYRWDGNRDFGAFVDLCAEVGLEVAARIGPWGHGESRNGGFPDWLMELGITTRTNDPAYLDIVRPWYAEIARQVDGRFWVDGGPIVAVQIENELCDQPNHLLTLKRIAQDAGFDVPLWTVTGWGRADIPRDEFLPLYGGYSEAAWDEHDSGWARQSRLHYFFTHVRDDFSIGSDLRQDGDGNARGASGPETDRYPFLTCELGGGMYTAYHRRPLVSAEDVAAISLVKLGCGSSWQGYYMYHGGTFPVGEHATTQESHDTDYPNDLPILNYDFQAPLGSFGQIRRSYDLLRQQALWIAAEGRRLARMRLTLPGDSPSDIDDRTSLRWAVRSDGDSGYLFVNNHQPVETLPKHEQVAFEVNGLGHRTVRIPTGGCTIEPGVFFAWPLRLDVAGARLSATAQVVTRVQTATSKVLILAATAGVPAELHIDGGEVDGVEPATVGEDGITVVRDLQPGLACVVRVCGPAGVEEIRVLTAEQGRQVSVVEGVAYVSAAPVVGFADGPAAVTTGNRERVHRLEENGWHTLDVATARPTVSATVATIRTASAPRDIPRGGSLGRASAPVDSDFDVAAMWTISLPDGALIATSSRDDELVLTIDYVGDVARLYAGERLLADEFWTGRPWEIGLRRFADGLADGLRLEILPLRERAPIYLSPGVAPEYDQGAALELRDVSLYRRTSHSLNG